MTDTSAETRKRRRRNWLNELTTYVRGNGRQVSSEATPKGLLRCQNTECLVARNQLSAEIKCLCGELSGDPQAVAQHRSTCGLWQRFYDHLPKAMNTNNKTVALNAVRLAGSLLFTVRRSQKQAVLNFATSAFKAGSVPHWKAFDAEKLTGHDRRRIRNWWEQWIHASCRQLYPDRKASEYEPREELAPQVCPNAVSNVTSFQSLDSSGAVTKCLVRLAG